MIAELLTGGDRDRLVAGEERLLRTSSELRELETTRGRIRPYTDPRLASNRRALLGFFRML